MAEVIVHAIPTSERWKSKWDYDGADPERYLCVLDDVADFIVPRRQDDKEDGTAYIDPLLSAAWGIWQMFYHHDPCRLDEKLLAKCLREVGHDLLATRIEGNLSRLREAEGQEAWQDAILEIVQAGPWSQQPSTETDNLDTFARWVAANVPREVYVDEMELQKKRIEIFEKMGETMKSPFTKLDVLRRENQQLRILVRMLDEQMEK